MSIPQKKTKEIAFSSWRENLLRNGHPPRGHWALGWFPRADWPSAVYAKTLAAWHWKSWLWGDRTEQIPDSGSKLFYFISFLRYGHYVIFIKRLNHQRKRSRVWIRAIMIPFWRDWNSRIYYSATCAENLSQGRERVFTKSRVAAFSRTKPLCGFARIRIHL